MSQLLEQVARILPTRLDGRVARTCGATVAVADFPAAIGSMVQIDRAAGEPLLAEVIGFRDAHTLLLPLADLEGVRRGDRVRLLRTSRTVPVGPELLGRVIDALGRPLDARPAPALLHRAWLDRRPPPPGERPRIDQPLATGIRAIDALLTCGQGQRIGVFAGSGVGKSIALGMMARYTSADVSVVALVGERGRELNDFVQHDLGPQGLKRSVVVVATGDEPPVMRVRAALVATAVAEFFRDQGRNVLLIMDSLTRFALAQREIGLAAGEPPTTRGYTPSVFAWLSRLVERAGRSRRGSITGVYSVLVEADDPNEPIADAVRGLLDGHIWLSRKLASRGHYPAIDVLESLSRLMHVVAPPEQRQHAQRVREWLSAYRDHEDLISIGAYRRGSHAAVDTALALRDELDRFLRQPMQESCTLEAARRALTQLATAGAVAVRPASAAEASA
jgi:flagellum-specific ATP synthase